MVWLFCGWGTQTWLSFDLFYGPLLAWHVRFRNGCKKFETTAVDVWVNWGLVRILSKRMKPYNKHNLKLPKELGTARVILLTPLTFFHGGKINCVSVNGHWHWHCYSFVTVILESGIMVATWRGTLSLVFIKHWFTTDWHHDKKIKH